MRYPASEKLEIIRLVEQSHLPAKQTLDKLGIPRTTFYRWYDRFLTGGVDALEETASLSLGHGCGTAFPDDVRADIIDLALR
jgi:putative transposase